MTSPIIPWPGGKRRLAKLILPLFDHFPHQCYVEPFAGGAALLFMRAEPAKVEVLNDIHSELVRLYRCVQHHLDELVRQFRWSLSSREMFRWAQAQPPETLTDIQRAARFLYLQKLSFGAKLVGQSFGVDCRQPPRLNLLRLEEDLSAAHLRLARAVGVAVGQSLHRADPCADSTISVSSPKWLCAGSQANYSETPKCCGRCTGRPLPRLWPTCRMRVSEALPDWIMDALECMKALRYNGST